MHCHVHAFKLYTIYIRMIEKSKRRDSSEIDCAHRNVSYNCHRDFVLLLSGNAKLSMVSSTFF